MSIVTGPPEATELDGTAAAALAPVTSTRRSWRQPSTGMAVGCILALVGLYIGLQPIEDNSFLTHLATGRLILDHGVPTVDPYSFTAAGEPFAVQSWLASLLYALVEQAAGGVGLVLLMGATTATLAALVWRITGGVDELLARLAPAAAVTAVGMAMWSERPLLFGLIFLALTLLAADDRLDARWLLPIGWLWANTHGSFPYGIGVLVLMVIGRRLDRMGSGVERRALAWLTAGILSGVIGPLGTRILTTPLAAVQKREAFSFIREWQAPTYRTWWELAFVAGMLLAAAAIVRRPSWRAALPVAVFAVLALTALRNLPVFGLVALAPTAAGLAGLGSVVHQHRTRVAGLAVAATIAVSGLAVLDALGHDGVDLRAYPLDAVAFLDGRGVLDDPAERLASPGGVGNLLEYQRGTDARVFMDDRVDTFPEDVVRDYIELARGGEHWQELLDSYGITTVLWERDSALASLLVASDHWRETYRDDAWLVFTRS